VNRRGRAARRLAGIVWLLLAASVAYWPAGRSGIGWTTAAIALVPLLLPLAGIARGSRRAYGLAALMLAPALALALTELVANESARTRATATLALVFLAFASLIAALRSAPASPARKEP
jgi:uncharacterized membrane protein